MNLRKLLVVPALGLASLAFVACGDDGATTKTTPGATTDKMSTGASGDKMGDMMSTGASGDKMGDSMMTGASGK